MTPARWLKRGLDVVGATAGLVTFAPLIGATAIAVRLSMGGPVFFRQTRPGYKGRPFDVVKFRTMKDSKDPQGNLRPDAERLTRVGSFMRSASLDELPQLWNVLKGDMSLVGPRPLLMQYLPRYSKEQQRRHDVPPGITGWAQVNGRNTVDWPQRFALDVWYVDNWSLWLDAKILAKTMWKAVRREGISREGHVTMTEFMGGE
jgi:sugar transferase EpsL